LDNFASIGKQLLADYEPVQQEKVVERTRLIELLAQLRSQSNELAISLATVGATGTSFFLLGLFILQ
jgi:hypothetical protein